MATAKIKYKLMATFGTVIVVPVIALSIMLFRLSLNVEDARVRDRFEYARNFMVSAVRDGARRAQSRLSQLAEDPRFAALADATASGRGFDPGAAAVLAAEYGLDGLAVSASGGLGEPT